MMAVSREAAAGHWNRLLSTQGEHFLPLFRLLRLPFDLYFPAGWRWLHALTLAAHAGSVWLLYALSKAHLGRWGALTAAFLFGWNALGAEALIIKSQNTYVWCLLSVLVALACLVRSRPFGCGLALAAALCIDAPLALAAVPGLLLGCRLLNASLPRRVVVGACGLPATLGVVAVWCLRSPAASHTVLTERLWDGASGALYHYGFLVRHGPPERWVLAAAVAALSLLLYTLADRRWLLTILTLTILPTWIILSFRGAAGYQTSRYCYQSALAVAVAAGAVAGLPRMRRAAPVALLVMAPLYYWNQHAILQTKLALLRFAPSARSEFWIAWRTLFERSPTVTLPIVEVEPNLRTDEVFALLYPRGKPGTTLLDPTPESCAAVRHVIRGAGLAEADLAWGRCP